MNRADHPVQIMCRVLGVSPSGYYAWSKRRPSQRAEQDEVLKQRVKEIHRFSRGTYGSPRIHIELQEEGACVGRKRIARLMRESGLRGVCRRKWPVTTVRSDDGRPAPDLVNRNFSASAANQLWVADITYVPTHRGFLFLSVVVDAFSRRVVGWSMKDHLRTELVLDALSMALFNRRPSHVIHHSDQGCQYTSIQFGARCQREAIRPSMGSVGDCYDNALCESFFATLECELIDRTVFSDKLHARRAVFDFIEGWYNPHRRHSGLGYLSPVNFERKHDLNAALPN